MKRFCQTGSPFILSPFLKPHLNYSRRSSNLATRTRFEVQARPPTALEQFAKELIARLDQKPSETGRVPKYRIKDYSK